MKTAGIVGGIGPESTITRLAEVAVPLLDTARIHAADAVERMLTEDK